MHQVGSPSSSEDDEYGCRSWIAYATVTAPGCKLDRPRWESRGTTQYGSNIQFPPAKGWPTPAQPTSMRLSKADEQPQCAAAALWVLSFHDRIVRDRHRLRSRFSAFWIDRGGLVVVNLAPRLDRMCLGHHRKKKTTRALASWPIENLCDQLIFHPLCCNDYNALVFPPGAVSYSNHALLA